MSLSRVGLGPMGRRLLLAFVLVAVSSVVVLTAAALIGVGRGFQVAEQAGRERAACIVDRSGGRADVGVPLVALATLDVPAYPADALPTELAALPVEDPGSRRLAK